MSYQLKNTVSNVIIIVVDIRSILLHLGVTTGCFLREHSLVLPRSPMPINAYKQSYSARSGD